MRFVLLSLDMYLRHAVKPSAFIQKVDDSELHPPAVATLPLIAALALKKQVNCRFLVFHEVLVPS